MGRKKILSRSMFIDQRMFCGFQSAFFSPVWAQKVAVSIQAEKKKQCPMLCPHVLNP